ncbi:MetS family NSS transporter small subunit [Planctomycetota bacterium]
MPLSAWLMLLFGGLVLYGGLAVCIGIALRHHRNRTHDKV